MFLVNNFTVWGIPSATNLQWWPFFNLHLLYMGVNLKFCVLKTEWSNKDFIRWVFPCLAISSIFFILLKWRGLSLDYYGSYFLWNSFISLCMHMLYAFMISKKMNICCINALLCVFIFLIQCTIGGTLSSRDYWLSFHLCHILCAVWIREWK